MYKITKTIWLLTILFAFNVCTIVPAYALSAVVHIPEKYTDVQAGERFYFEIDIKYPENPSRKDLKLNYEILKDDEVIAQSKLLKAIETQASFMDFIVIPESIPTGMYIINVNVTDYEDLSEDVSASFHVVGSGSEEIRIYFFLLLGAIILVGGLVIWEVKRSSK